MNSLQRLVRSLNCVNCSEDITAGCNGIDSLVCSAMDLIGNTPMVNLAALSCNPHVRLFGKLEGCNPGGSIKDRAARQMILDAVISGSLQPGMSLLEATSGNTGTAIAIIGRILGLPVELVIPEATSIAKREDMLRFGAQIHIVPGDTTEGARAVALNMSRQFPGKYFFTDQYTNQSNLMAHYLFTGPEILSQCPEVTHVIAGQGSFGTLGGIARRCREDRPSVKIISVVARPGITTLFGLKEADQQMPLVDDSLLHSRLMMDARAAHEGIQAGLRMGYQLGPSAGAVLGAAMRFAERAPDGSRLVCIFADTGSKYPGCVLYNAHELDKMTLSQADHEHFTKW